jgi:hypothetical protein
MPFEDLAAFIAPGLDLPIGGKTYSVPEPGVKEGLYLQAIVDTGESLAISAAIASAENRRARRGGGAAGSVVTDSNRVILSDSEERTVYQLALGSVYDEMVADGVSWPRLKHAGMTAVICWTRGLESAERYWAGYGQGKAQAAEGGSPTSSGTPPEDPSTPLPA